MLLIRYEGRVQFSWREWCPTAINIVDYCMGTGQSLLPVAHAWLWVIRRVQLAEEAKESADSEDADELARQSEKLTADWHRRMALVKLNAFRAKRSEMIGHPEGVLPACCDHVPVPPTRCLCVPLFHSNCSLIHPTLMWPNRTGSG